MTESEEALSKPDKLGKPKRDRGVSPPTESGRDRGFDDEVLEDALAAVTVHEVGHTLGLRHNFRGSLGSDWSPDKSGRTTASVMDYVPLGLRSADVGKELKAYKELSVTSIGPYDIWAIRYGYEKFSDAKAGKSIADEGDGVPAYAFASDEDDGSAEGADPTANLFDIGDPLLFYKDRLELVRKQRALKPGLIKRASERSTSLNFNNLYAKWELNLVNTVFSSITFLGKHLGGMKFNRNHQRTEPPMKPISWAEQVSAIDALCDVLSDDPLTRSESIFPNPADQIYAVDTCCDEEHQYGKKAFDIMKIADKVREAVMDTLTSPKRLLRLQRHKTLLGVPHATRELFERATVALFGSPVDTTKLQAQGLWPAQLKWAEHLRRIQLEGSKAGLLDAAAAADYFAMWLQKDLEELQEKGSKNPGESAVEEAFHVKSLLLLLTKETPEDKIEVKESEPPKPGKGPGPGKGPKGGPRGNGR